MCFEIWNAKGNTKLYYKNSNSYGYNVGTSSSPGSYYVSGLSTSDSLYFPVTNSTASDANGNYYWLASPCASGDDALIHVAAHGRVGMIGYGAFNISVRPIVRLKATIYGQKNANGVWQLQ